MFTTVEYEFLIWKETDGENNGKGVAVVFDNLKELNQSIQSVTSYHDYDEFGDRYYEYEAQAVFADMMRKGILPLETNKVEIVNGEIGEYI